MIIHLHFLPLTTTLLAITSRMFVITVDMASYLVQYRDASHNRLPADASGSSTPVPGSGKDKEKDKVSFSFEDVVNMVISGKMQNSRIATAQQQLEARLQVLNQQAKQEDKGKGRSVGTLERPERMALLEMDGEDFGEAVEVVPRSADLNSRTASVNRKIPRTTTTIVLDPSSSPDEPRVQLPDVSVLTDIADLKADPHSTKAKKVSSEEVDATGVFASSFSAIMPKQLPKPLASVDESAGPASDEAIPKQKKGQVTDYASGTKIPIKRKSSSLSAESKDKPKFKRKKAKDTMDDIFGL